jgi:arylsulfatase A-like enzyme
MNGTSPDTQPRADLSPGNALLIAVLLWLLAVPAWSATAAKPGSAPPPAAEKLAGGLRYNRFHTTAICSATRRALLMGRNRKHMVDPADAIRMALARQ